MSATPAAKTVSWNVNSREAGSPATSDTSTETIVPTSSLDYVNSQLIAHGFVPSPGLSLDGVTSRQLERTVKCLLDLLGQRMRDMSRTENLATELRTLTYDHERLLSMQRNAAEKAANAEREMNMHKSKLIGSQKALESAEASHKTTMAELQRARTALQAVRMTHQTELKKRDKEMERINERWAKIADSQTKLSTIQSGIRCANVTTSDATQTIERGRGFLEVSLEEAQKSRSQLQDENTRLKRIILTVVNESRSVLCELGKIVSGANEEPPPNFTLTSLFPLSPPNFASEKLAATYKAIRELLPLLTLAPQDESSKSTSSQDSEVSRLNAVVNGLHDQLEKAKQQIFAQSQARIDGSHASEAEELVKLRDEICKDRAEVAESRQQLAAEREQLESDRKAIRQAQRALQVQKILGNDSPSPESPPSASRGIRPISVSPKRSLRQSLRKTSPTFGRNSGWQSGKRPSLLLSPSKKLVQLSFETEVLPPMPNLPLPTSSLAFKPSLGQAASLLPTTFSLPPRSPHSLFPSNPPLPPSTEDPFSATTDVEPLASKQPPATPTLPSQTFTRPSFPVAKPLAPRMIHAYSPARPSPLRLVSQSSLGGSTQTPSDANTSVPLEALLEVNEDDIMNESSLEAMFPSISLPNETPLFSNAIPPVDDAPTPVQKPELTLAQELGIPDSPPEQLTLAQELGVSESPPDTPVFSRPETPLQEKKLEKNLGMKRESIQTTAKGRLLHSFAREKGRSTILPSNAIRETGKENSGSSKKQPDSIAARARATAAASVKTTRKSAARSRIVAKPAAASSKSDGPRRVPVDSAEAMPLPKHGHAS